MTRNQMIAAGDFAIEVFGPETDVEIDDDGSATITTEHAVLESYFSFDRDKVARLTLIP